MPYQVNWPPINFLDPAPPPRSRKKAPGFFDEYLPDSEEDSPGNSEISKIKKEIENEDEIVNILQGGIDKERQRLKVLEDVKQSHDDTRNSKIEEYNKLVQELENRNMIDSSEEVEDIQV